jgi:hypothetical protein
MPTIMIETRTIGATTASTSENLETELTAVVDDQLVAVNGGLEAFWLPRAPISSVPTGFTEWSKNHPG